MNLTQEEALRKLEELRQYIEKLNKKTLVLSKGRGCEYLLNGKWALSLFNEESEGDPRHVGAKLSGHKASVYLTEGSGQWYTQDGVSIHGYLYFKPNEE